MQMRKMYQTTNHAKLAEIYAKAGQECEKAGFYDSADINYAMADYYTPYVPDETDNA